MKKRSFSARLLYAIRWYLFSLIPVLAFGALSALHAYRAKHLPGQENLVLSLEQIYVSSEILFASGVIFSGCMLVMVIINDLFSLIGRLSNKWL